MTGAEFERYMADLFQQNGFWALRIPKNERGAQPFDILAIKGDRIYAVDCKVCARSSFPVERVEDNQWLSMDIMQRRTTAIVGFAVYHDGMIYFIPYDELKMSNAASIRLDETHLWAKKEL